FFSSRRRHTRFSRDWSSDVCSSDLIGAAAAACMFFVTGSNWALGVGLLVIATICLGSSLVVYDAVLVQIAHEDERDRVSSRGWRSEERRVGKECRAGWWRGQEKETQ